MQFKAILSMKVLHIETQLQVYANTSSKLTATDSATPVALSGRFPCCTVHGSRWISPIISVRFISTFCNG